MVDGEWKMRFIIVLPKKLKLVVGNKIYRKFRVDCSTYILGTYDRKIYIIFKKGTQVTGRANCACKYQM